MGQRMGKRQGVELTFLLESNNKKRDENDIIPMSREYYDTLTQPESYAETGEGFGTVILPGEVADVSAFTNLQGFATTIPT